MKKGLSKLILSGAAVAACAATLGTSTYAWYTTNTEVKANNVSGASADSGASSIYISANGGTNWYSKVSGTATGTDKITFTSTQLTPVTLQTNSGTPDYKWVNEKGEVNSTPTFVEFTLYFKAVDNAAPVKVGINAVTIENKTAAAKAKENYLTGASYTVDFLDSLAVQFSGDLATDSGAIVDTHGYSLKPGTGCVVAGADDVDYNTTYATSYANKPAVDAHDYVKAVTNDPNAVTVTSTTTTTLASEAHLLTIPTGGGNANKKGITFRVFLDGANTECYDACRDQLFNVSFSFTVID